MASAIVVQTRSEENGIQTFNTLKEAMQHASKDRTVWKISFGLPSNERVRLIRIYEPPCNRNHEWVYESIL